MFQKKKIESYVSTKPKTHKMNTRKDAVNKVYQLMSNWSVQNCNALTTPIPDYTF